MPRAKPGQKPPRPTIAISRGNRPITPEERPPEPLPPPPPPKVRTPEEEKERKEQLLARGLLMAAMYAELGSYAKVAEIFQVAPGTVRWWRHEIRKQNAEKLDAVAARLRGDIAQLAADRVQEGLVEGSTEFAAILGTKVLHGLGELKSHATNKNDGVPSITNLQITVIEAKRDVGEVLEGSVVGVPRSLAAPEAVQTAAEAD